MTNIGQESDPISKDFSSPIISSSFHRSRIYPYLTIFILIGLIATIDYSNTFSFPFQFDDLPLIVNNPQIKNYSALLDISKSRYVGNLSFALNYHTGGLSTFGYHLTNLMIHIADGILIYLMVLLLCRTPLFASDASVAPISHWMASATALLFVSHPIQTEAVTYIVQRYVSLSTLFYLLALIGYLKWRLSLPLSHRRSLWYAGALLATILAMKTRESTFTIPFMLLLVEGLFFTASSRRWVPLIPFFLTLPIIPLSLPVTLVKSVSGIARETVSITRWDYLVTQFTVLVTYLRLLIFPKNQNLDYDFPIHHSIFEPPVLLSLLFLSALFIFAVCLLFIPARSRLLFVSRFAAFGILWFFITLSIESSIIPIRDVIFEHRLNLPSVGFFLAVCAPLSMAAARWKIPTTLLLAACVVILSLATYQRNEIWKDAASLWSDVLIKSPNKARPHLSRGTAYDDAGQWEDAAREYHAALRLQPDFAQAYNNLGMIYLKQGKNPEARSEFEQAIRIRPSLASAHNNLGLVLVREGELPNALAAFEKTIQLNRNFAEGYYNLGNVYRDMGNLAKAAQNYQMATQLDPDNAKSHMNLGLAFYFQGRSNEALAQLKLAVQKGPQLAEAHNNLGIVYRRIGRFNDAVREYLAALALQPQYFQAYINLGVAYEDLGQLNEAAKAFEAALTLNPRAADVHNELGNVFFMLGRHQDAISQYETAVQLKPDFDEAYYRLGIAYRGNNQMQEARRSFQRTLKINPNHQKAREALKSLPSK
jgi:protein O-mannosyl-transferase